MTAPRKAKSMFDAIMRRIFGKRRLVCYSFPAFIPGSGESIQVDGFGHNYCSARLDAMSRVDTGRYVIGPGVEKTVGGDTLH